MQTKDRPHEHLVLPRSETIRNLSSFVEYLDWIKPSAPNADLCYRVRDIISQVLDRVLDFPAQSTDMCTPRPSQTTVDNLGLPSDFPDFDDFGNFSLPDYFDWTT